MFKSAFLVIVAVATAYGQKWAVTSTSSYTLPDIRLSDFLASHLGIQVDDHNINLGGIGSDLWHSASDGAGIYWMITDRGPNGQIVVGTQTRRTFPIPEFTPFILKVQTGRKGIQILDAIPLTGLGSTLGGITGLSNNSRDEAPYDCAAQTLLGLNAHGLDTEGLIRLPDGTFWSVDEYSPSLVKIDSTGRVIRRFVPANLTPALETPGYQTMATLPEILGKRKINRGFEGIALSPDGKTIYVVVQSPLLNPDTASGNASLNTRILAFDLATENVTAEYVYRFQPVSEFNDTNPTEMKLSALAMLDDSRMLVLERTDKIAKIYRVDLSTATNILGTKWDAAATAPALETLSADALEGNGVATLPKTLVTVLDSAKGYPGKIEGMTVLDKRTIAIANDNDFGLGDFNLTGGRCVLMDTGTKSSIMKIRFDKSLLQ